MNRPAKLLIFACMLGKGTAVIATILLCPAAWAQYNVVGKDFTVQTGATKPSLVERLHVTQSGLVGIGTPSPAYSLDVSGTVRAGAFMGNGSQLTNLPVASTDRIISGSAYVQANSNNTVGISGTTYIGNATSTDAGLKIGGSVTGNHSSYLDFIGDATYSTYGLRLIRGSTGANATSMISHRGTGALTLQTVEAAPLIFATSNTESMRLTPEGFLGIGTSTPSSTLHVYGGSSSAISLGRVNGSTALSSWAYNGSTMTFGTLTTDQVGLITNNTTRLYITAGGRVGVGTTTPTTALQVYSDASYNTDSSAIFETNGHNHVGINAADGYDAILSLQEAGVHRWRISNKGSSSNRLDIRNQSSTSVVTVLQNGYVGLGTTSPTGGLDVVADGGSGDDVTFEANSNSVAGNSALLAFARSRGTLSSKTAAINGDTLGLIRFLGHNGSAYSTGAAISSVADGNFDTAGTRSSNLIFYTTNANSYGERMRIDPNGFIGIGTASPAVTLHVSGTLRVQNGSVVTCNIGTGTGATSCTSDARLKKDIAPIANALEKVSHLNGVTFQWKAKDTPQGEHIGVIAQDVEKVFPQAVDTIETGMKTVDYAVLVAPLIEAVKELKTDNDNLRARLEKLESERAAVRR